MSESSRPTLSPSSTLRPLSRTRLDGTVSKLRYAAFHLLPYYPQFQTNILVTELTGLDNKDLGKLAGADVEEPDDEDLD